MIVDNTLRGLIMSLSLYIFYAFILAIACQRILEVFVSHRHEKALIALGGREHAPEHFIFMKLIHIGWLISMVLEAYVFERPFYWFIFLPALMLTSMGQALRYATMTTLKDRWTVRIMTIPDAPPVTEGIFRYVRHPNYIGVVLEIMAIPMLHSAYLTALIFSILNGLLLMVRISAEEKALREENNYGNYFGVR